VAPATDDRTVIRFMYSETSYRTSQRVIDITVQVSEDTSKYVGHAINTNLNKNYIRTIQVKIQNSSLLLLLL